MTVPCPHCQQTIELGIAHHGVSSTGLFQRMTIEATHASGEGIKPCPGFATNGVDLVSLANSVHAS